MGIQNGRIALTVTPKGIDTIAFIGADKSEAVSFYALISKEIEVFELRVKALVEQAKGVEAN